ncbi:Vacuolar protein sorting-associated protein 35 [Pleurotus ostreatus]|uniref:Vacuolar protein sorting-associated protein 35 n=3 Tax=Pleurotus TaxID=5320 RepID=A0A8H7A3T5_PLEOS|nr:Vacuolar protein sorting-associated protein 35 [Pleurotus ostreatus]KAF7437326.1 Vacuolar protein sorting-associated protein 35 [Pleurotus ostreatus]
MAQPVVEEGKLLSEALNTVKIQVQQMKRHLELDQLMDALKSASLMLAELRTSSLSPKQYYELYMAVFDALRHLTNYLYDAHTQGKHHLADLYELVQYAGNIVPRLYLMITVGAVYMSIPEAPVKEIMKDMMEMSRGVLHPIRGLFLRHYLSGQTRDHLPVGVDPGPTGCLQDSTSFVLTNFIEMNKLWVRLQHQGHSRDREKREMERRELRILVGTNLVRLSQLDGVDLDLYQKIILPSVLEQIVSCKDVIAQEYLMEVVIQVFTDEFHLHTLGPFLSATAQLHPKVNIKQIVIALIDRLAAYAAREAENEDPEETKRQEEAAAKRLAEKVELQKANRHRESTDSQIASSTITTESSPWDAVSPPQTPSTAVEHEKPEANGANGVVSTEKVEEKGKSVEGVPVRKFRGIPEDVRLFEVFWKQVVELIKARPDLSIQDITALLVSLTNLSLSCYPDRLEYVDQVLGFTAEKIKEFKESPDLNTQQTTSNLAALLVAPINSYQSILTLLAIPNYVPLLSQQLFFTRRSIAHSVISSVLKNETIIETPEDCDGVLELCHVLIKDQTDSANPNAQANREEMAEEQGWVARMVHLFRAESLDVQFQLLQVARRHFEAGGERMRFTFPALITSAIRICRRYKLVQHAEDDWRTKVANILKFVRQLTSILATQVEAPTIALRLFLLAAQISDECDFEDLTYDLYVQAFSVYEDCISESRAQLQAITLIIGTLAGAKVFGVDNYDTLVTKAALHGAKLLKKSHQATAVGLASHLWWQESVIVADGESAGAKETTTEKPAVDGDSEDAPKAFPHQDSKRVLECLQKSLRIANSAIEEIVTVQLYCDTLDQYLYYLDHGAPAVAPKFVNSLVELITSSVDAISSPDVHPSQRAPPGLLEGVQTPEMITRHFRNTLLHIQRRKKTSSEGTAGGHWAEVDVVGALLKMGILLDEPGCEVVSASPQNCWPSLRPSMAVLAPPDWTYTTRESKMDVPSQPNPSAQLPRASPNDHGSSPSPSQVHQQHLGQAQQQQQYPFSVQQQPQGSWTPSITAPPFYPSFYQNHQQQPQQFAAHGQGQVPQQTPFFDPNANAQLAQWAYQQMMFNAQQGFPMIPPQQFPSQQRMSPGTGPVNDYYAQNQISGSFSPYTSGTPPPHRNQGDHHQPQQNVPPQQVAFHPYRRPNRQASHTPDNGEWRPGGPSHPPYIRADASGSTTSVNSSNSQRQRTNSIQSAQSGHNSSASNSGSVRSRNGSPAIPSGSARSSPAPTSPQSTSSASSSRIPPHNRKLSSSSSTSNAASVRSTIHSPSLPTASTSSVTINSTSTPMPNPRPVRPSPLSQGNFTLAEKRMSRDDSDLNPMPTPAMMRSGGLKGRLKRVLSLNASATLREEKAESEEPSTSGPSTPKASTSTAATATPKGPDDDAASTATVQTKKKGRAASLFNLRNASTDNISLSSTVSSASVMIRKLGSMGRLARRNSLAGITSLFKDKDKDKDGEGKDKKGKKKDKKAGTAKGEASEASVSHVTAELDRMGNDWNDEFTGLSPAAELARRHTLKSNQEAAAKLKAQQEAAAAAAAAAQAAADDTVKINGVNGNDVGVPTWDKNTATRQGSPSPIKAPGMRVNEDGTRVLIEDDDEDQSEDGHFGVSHTGPTYNADGWDDDDDWGEEDEDVTIRMDVSRSSREGEDGDVEPWAVDVRRSVERSRKPAKGILKGANNFDQHAYLTEHPTPNRPRSNSYNSSHTGHAELGPLARIPSPDPDHIDGLHRHNSHSSAHGPAAGASIPALPPLSFDATSTLGSLSLESPKEITSSPSPTSAAHTHNNMFSHPNLSAPTLSVMPSAAPTLTHRSATTPGKRLAFASNLAVYDTFSATVYDRRSEPATWSRLTPALAQRIKEELNSYKMEEMEVHAASRIHTQFFV